MTNSLDSVLGSTAYGPDEQKIGKVKEIYFSNENGSSTWVSVSTGLFGSDSLVPLAGASHQGDSLRVAVDKDAVKSAPQLARPKASRRRRSGSCCTTMESIPLDRAETSTASMRRAPASPIPAARPTRHVARTRRAARPTRRGARPGGAGTRPVARRSAESAPARRVCTRPTRCMPTMRWCAPRSA